MKKRAFFATSIVLCLTLSSCSGSSAEQEAEGQKTCKVLIQTVSRINASGLSRKEAEKRFEIAALSIDALAKKNIPQPLTDSLVKLSMAYKDFVSRYKDSTQALSETVTEIDYASQVSLEECSKYLK